MKTDDRRPLFRRSLAGVVLAAVLLALWGAATHGSLPSGSTEPAIASLTPESGPEGMVVTIRGTNFGPSVGALQGTSGVSFNGVWSTPTSWSDGEIRVLVPPGAATGSVVVTVSSQPSNGVEFTVTGTGGSGPAIGTVSPALGPEGTVVTVRGARFGSTADMGGVSFNGVWASASSWSDREIRVPVPADAATGSVLVTANGQASNGVAFTVTDSGTGEPAVNSLSAASGPEGMVVRIEGENFGSFLGTSQGTSGVSFNGVWAVPTYWSETEIEVLVPAGAPSGLVTVTVGGEGSNGLAFVVERLAPLIEAVDSSFGREGTTVEITGTNFGPSIEASQGWSGVSFDGLWGMPTYWSDREIHVSAPAGVSSGLIVVRSAGQASNGISFTVTGAKTMSRTVAASSVAPRAGPELKSLDPAGGSVGTPVKIKGKNLGDEQGGSTVTFNGTAVTNYISWRNKRIDVAVPAGATTGDVVVTVGGVATSGIEFTVTAGTDPAISSLDPDSGPEGTSVEITGTNFGATQGTSTVAFNGTGATPTGWSDTSITVAVPMGAATGDVVVTVDGTPSNGVSFAVTPAISSLSPIAGPEGATVEITGTSFGAMQGTSSVTFNGTPVATYTSWSDTSITVAVPMGAATGDVVVTVDGTPSNGVSFAVTPAISSLSPIAGPEGATVEITGTSFGAMQGTSSVTFNGTPVATYTSWSDTSITVAVPEGAATGNVVVTVGGQASNGVSFAVGTDPVISGLNPDSGPAGTTVEITGANFGASQGTSTVGFNGAGATPTNWSDTSITVTVPANATTGPVVVTVDGTPSNAVTFSVKPAISGLSRVSGPEGATVVITGTGFGAMQGTSSVTFNGTGATPTSWSATSITVTVPANAATGSVVVTVGGTPSDGVSFTVTPSISSLSPIAGPEGATVVITGTSFGAMQGMSTVTFNGVAATATSWSATSITVTVPTGATTGSVVVTVGGEASNGVSFTVGTDPIVTSLSPALGQVETTVVIGGANFGASQGTSTVTFNGVAATPTSWSDASITVTVPAAAATGPVVVTVGGVASNQVTFTVTGPPPVISKLKPGEGEVGDSVKIKGEHFGTAQGTSKVTFNGEPATARKWDDSKITVNVPAGARTGPVVVTVEGQASNPVTFSVTGSSPSIISLDPTSGEVGTSVTITGVHFGATQGTGTITFNGVTATATSWSDTSITVPVPATAATGPVVVTVGGQVSNGVTFTVTVPAPSITGLNPTEGRVGASVAISGENFGASRGTSAVTFNGTPVATYTIWSDTSITVTVPTNATMGSVVVTVGGQVSNGVEFTVDETLPGVTVTETTLDVVEGNTGTYQVKLDTLPEADVTVTLASSNADVTLSSGTLTFSTSNWNTAQEVTVTGEQDDDGADGTATISHTAASTDTGYNGITIGSVVVSVEDDDPFGVTVTEATLDVDEGNTGIYQVKLDTEPSADVTITPASGDTDVATVSPPLTFTTTNWNAVQTVTVTGVEDDDGVNGTATVSHTTASSDTDYDGFSPIGSVKVSVEDNDPLGVTVTAQALEVDEGDTGTYEVKLDTEPGADVTVSLSSDNTDVTLSSGTLTFTTTNWNTPQTVTVTAKEDDDDYADETVAITHTAASSDPDYDGFTPIGSVEVSVDDNDDPPGVTVTETTLEVTEGSTGTYQVKLDTEPSAEVTVAVASSDTDVVTVSSGTLTFTTTNWSTAQTVTVTAKEDDDPDAETATITHTAASTDTDYDGITPIGSVAVSVTDNDPPGVTVTEATLEVDEGRTGTYQVKLDTLPEAEVTVSLSSDNTDVTLSSETLTFTTTSWSTAQTVTVTAKEDDDDYDNETATITHTAASTDTGYDGITIGSVAVDVIDNDDPRITLSSGRTSVSEPSGTDTITASVPSGYAPEADLTITLAHSGTAGHGTSADYTVGALTILAGQTSGTAALMVRDDSIDEDEETITLTGSASDYRDSSTLSIALEDDDTAGLVVSTASLDVDEGGTGQFQVKLDTEPLNNVTVSIAEASDAISLSDTALTFTSSNWSAYQTVTVTAVEDNSNYADEEATITAGATSSDPKYNVTSLNQTVSVGVDDNEDPPITLSSGRTSVSEPSGTDTITASVPSGYEPEADLTITLAHSGTAGHGTSADYTVGTLTITANQTSGTATLTVRDDSIDEDEETITLTGSASDYESSDALSIALEDDDTAGLVVSTASLDVDEGGTGQFQVKLDTEPLNNVTVSLAEASDAISLSDTALTFTSSNWSAYQTVTVTGVEDNSNYGNAEATITASATSSDPKYNITSLNQTVDVDVGNIDVAPISLTSSETSVSEDSGKRTATITATVPATAEPGSDLTIALAHSGTATHGTNNDYTMGALTILANQTSGTATLAVRDDRIDEGSSETITLTGSASGYTASSTLSIPLNDDDTAGLVVSPTSLDITEGDDGIYRVKLNSRPTQSVSVGFSVSGSSTVTVPTSSRTFTTSNWNTYQAVTVRTAEDNSDYDDETATATNSATSGDQKYNTNSLNRTVGVDVTDNDVARISLTSSETSVSEASGSRTATIRATVPATAQPGSDLTITLAHSGTAGHGSSSDYTVGTLEISAGATSGTATLAVRDDRIDEGSSETITLTGSASGYMASSALSIPLNDDDTAGLVVSPSSLDINEGGTGQLRVKLNSQPTANVSVRVSETSSKISVSTTLTFTPNNWNSYQTATVRGSSDSDCADQSATVTLTASSDDTRYDGLQKRIGVDVDDDDSPTISLRSSSSSVSEPNGTARITATLGCTSSVDKTINLTHSGSAEHGTNKDYTVGTLMITAGQLSGTATLTVRDDQIDEGSSETIRLKGSAGGYTASSTLSITLNDNDTAGLVVSTMQLDIDEGDTGQFRVKLNSEPTHSVSVSFSVSGSSTVTVPTGSLTFTPNNWNTYQTATVRGSSDSDCADQSATLTLTASSDDTRYDGLQKTIGVDVDDDDSPTIRLKSSSSSVSEPNGTARITATLGCTSSVDKTINLSDLGSADEGSNKDYTVATLTVTRGQLTGTATLTVIDDQVAEGTETITMGGSTGGYSNSSNLSITLNDNDMPGLVVTPTSLTIGEGMSKNYTVKLKSQPTNDVTVSVSETSDKIDASATLNFTSNNWNTKKTVTVAALQDDDCANESATVKNESSSSDSDYEGLSVNVLVTVDDDESPTIRLSSNRSSVLEPNGTATITATLGCTSSVDKTITLTHSGTAEHGSNKDYTVATLTVDDSELTGTATLTVKDDNICEGTETIKLTGSTSGYTNSPLLSINLNDNDTAGIVVSPTSLTIDEGKSKSYTVKLNSQPTARVTVGVLETSGDISVSSTSLTFSTTSWGTSQTVTVTAAVDNSDYSNESATITNSAESDDSKYDTSTLNKTVSVSVTDDDTPPPRITSISLPLRPDDEVTISGSNFGPSQGSVSFGFDSVTEFSSWSNTSIRCHIPIDVSAGTVSVKVTDSGGTQSSAYNYTISGQSPFRGDCGDADDCPGDEKPKKDGSEEGEGSDSGESEDPPGDGG